MEKHPLHSKYPELHKSPEVLSATQHQAQLEGRKKPASQPGEKLDAWLAALERTHTGKGASEQRQAAQGKVTERIRDLYHRPASEGGYITGTDETSIERYLHHQAVVAHQQGHGEVADIMGRINSQVRSEAKTSIVADQERSLDRWYDYLTSEDATYPTWFSTTCFAILPS